jgi:hypothetical protein
MESNLKTATESLLLKIGVENYEYESEPGQRELYKNVEIRVGPLKTLENRLDGGLSGYVSRHFEGAHMDTIHTDILHDTFTGDTLVKTNGKWLPLDYYVIYGAAFPCIYV